MARSNNGAKSISTLLMQIALGCLLLISGIWGLQGGGDEAVKSIRHLFNGSAGDIFAVVFSIIELIAGFFLILSLFVPLLASLNTIFLFIVMIVWIVAIVLMDFLGNSGIFNGGAKHFLTWLYNFAYHLLVLAAIIRIKY